MSTLTLGSVLPTLKVELARAAASKFGLKVTLPAAQTFTGLTAVLVLETPTGEVLWTANNPVSEGDAGNTQVFYWELTYAQTNVTWKTCDVRLEFRRSSIIQVIAAGKVRLSS
jgi:hypothetical protein